MVCGFSRKKTLLGDTLRTIHPFGPRDHAEAFLEDVVSWLRNPVKAQCRTIRGGPYVAARIGKPVVWRSDRALGAPTDCDDSLYGTICTRERAADSWEYGLFVPAAVLMHVIDDETVVLTWFFRGEKLQPCFAYTRTGVTLVGEKYVEFGTKPSSDSPAEADRRIVLHFLEPMHRAAFITRLERPFGAPLLELPSDLLSLVFLHLPLSHFNGNPSQAAALCSVARAAKPLRALVCANDFRVAWESRVKTLPQDSQERVMGCLCSITAFPNILWPGERGITLDRTGRTAFAQAVLEEGEALLAAELCASLRMTLIGMPKYIIPVTYEMNPMLDILLIHGWGGSNPVPVKAAYAVLVGFEFGQEGRAVVTWTCSEYDGDESGEFHEHAALHVFNAQMGGMQEVVNCVEDWSGLNGCAVSERGLEMLVAMLESSQCPGRDLPTSKIIQVLITSSYVYRQLNQQPSALRPSPEKELDTDRASAQHQAVLARMNDPDHPSGLLTLQTDPTRKVIMYNRLSTMLVPGMRLPEWGDDDPEATTAAERLRTMLLKFAQRGRPGFAFDDKLFYLREPYI